jgi:probable HAF family extracellular repeat protein
MPRLHTPAGVLALVVALPLVAAPAAQASATITELAGLPGHPVHRAIAVNNLDQVVGVAEGNGKPRAVRWVASGTAATDLGLGRPSGLNQVGQVLIEEGVSLTGPFIQRPRIWQDGAVTDLTPSGAGVVIASAISNKGVVPMTYSTSSSGYHQEKAVVWRDGEHTSLPLVGPHLWASAVNDAGVVAGSKAPMFGTDVHAFLCPDTTTCKPLAAVPGSSTYSVEAINEAGVVVGNRDTKALRWEGDQVTVLSTSGGVANGSQAINERGDVVGWTTDASGTRRATLWPAGGRPVTLNVPGRSEAVAVNDRGDVIGWTGSASAPRGFLWRNGKVVHLGSLGGTRSLPVALNERGTVVGESTTGDSTVKAVKWTVVG